MRTPPQKAKTPNKPSATTYALLIGIEKYKDIKLGPADFSERDAEDLYRILTEAPIGKLPKENVELLLTKDADVTNLGRAIRRLFRRVTPLDTVFLYFAGHGKSVETGGYLLPRNFEDTQVVDMDTEAYSFSALNRHLRARRPWNFVFIFDCCFSGKALEQVDLNYDIHYRGDDGHPLSLKKDYDKQYTNDWEAECQCRMVVCSSLADELSVAISNLGHGVFSSFLIEGLRGEADQDRDGYVDMDELLMYVKAKMSTYNRQHNIYQNLGVYGKSFGKFYLPSWGKLLKDSKEEREVREIENNIHEKKFGDIQNATYVNKHHIESTTTEEDVPLVGFPGCERLVWKTNMGSDFKSGFSIGYGCVYVICADGSLNCLDANKGFIRWQHVIPPSNRYYEEGYLPFPFIYNHMVCIFDKRGAICCFEPKRGIKLSEIKTDIQVCTDPCINGDRIYVGGKDYKIFCIDGKGSRIWEYKAGYLSRKALHVTAGRLYFVSNDKICCLDAKVGTKLWEYRLRKGAYSDIYVVNNYICISDFDRKIYCFSAKNGNKLWDFVVNLFELSMYFSGSNIYITNEVGKLICLEVENGEKLWETQIGHSPSTYHKWYFLCGDKDQVYLNYNERAVSSGEIQGIIYCFDGYQGMTLWKCEIESGVREIPYLIKGHLYFGSFDGEIYCISTRK